MSWSLKYIQLYEALFYGFEKLLRKLCVRVYYSTYDLKAFKVLYATVKQSSWYKNTVLSVRNEYQAWKAYREIRKLKDSNTLFSTSVNKHLYYWTCYVNLKPCGYSYKTLYSKSYAIY